MMRSLLILTDTSWVGDSLAIRAWHKASCENELSDRVESHVVYNSRIRISIDNG